MAKKVALVGHCGPDSSFLRMAIGQAAKGVSIVNADDEAELEQMVSAGGVDLVLFNRILDFGFSTSSGAEVIKRVKTLRPGPRVMMVTNYPDAQAEAVANGALPGFGKREIGSAKVDELLKSALE